MTDKQKNIRNFSIIAHIDHGKSTLADRILEATRAVDSHSIDEQMLDNMDLERERGITIKARTVSLSYRAENGEEYFYNLIDTPGHVDFGYEVSRSLKACEGAILVVDATQGVEAQTLANAYLAIDNDLEILPVINKIDLPSADVPRVREEIEEIIGVPAEDCPAVSAKTGQNIRDVLERLITDIPAPEGDPEAPLKCLVFDSYYDSYLGVVVYVRVFDGTLRAGDRIRIMSTGAVYDVVSVGTPGAFAMNDTGVLSAGEVGYITASMKTVGDTRIGDTITHAEGGVTEPLPGFRPARPMVYAGIYPADGARYGDLRDALEKLRLNDAALSYEPETSVALGFGYRCGFLGLLHMEIIEER
ncbi:MAG: translation elongation factor 4, partial [Clostridia bacterium]|nr:translation elongation factor 4 [Clostridia bacterium]